MSRSPFAAPFAAQPNPPMTYARFPFRRSIEYNCHSVESVTFFFTVGDEPYTRDWTHTVLKLHDSGGAYPPRGWLAVALTIAYRRTKRFIKQSPILWRTFSKARGIAGSLGVR